MSTACPRCGWGATRKVMARIGRYNFLEWDDSMAEEFFAGLEQRGTYAYACDVIGVDPRAIQIKRRNEPDFQAMCDVALSRYAQMFADEAARRALEGDDEPIIGGRNRDQVVAHVRKRSDRLLVTMLKATDPERFGDKREVVVSGKIDLVTHFEYGELPQRARQLLREILDILIERRREAAAFAKLSANQPRELSAESHELPEDAEVPEEAE